MNEKKIKVFLIVSLIVILAVSSIIVVLHVTTPTDKLLVTVNTEETEDEYIVSLRWFGEERQVEVSGNATLAGLEVGVHNVTVFGFDASGNMGTSETVFFTIEEPAPFPTIPVAVASVTAFAIVITGLLMYLRKRKS